MNCMNAQECLKSRNAIGIKDKEEMERCDNKRVKYIFLWKLF
jgi:hypothetical protein